MCKLQILHIIVYIASTSSVVNETPSSTPVLSSSTHLETDTNTQGRVPLPRIRHEVVGNKAAPQQKAVDEWEIDEDDYCVLSSPNTSKVVSSNVCVLYYQECVVRNAQLKFGQNILLHIR